MREYGVKLEEILWPDPPFSPRYILSLIQHMPLDCDTVAHLRGGDEYKGWDQKQYALVALTNSVRHLVWLTLAVNAKKKPKPLEPIPTPGTNKKSRATGKFALMANSQIAMAKRRKGG